MINFVPALIAVRQLDTSELALFAIAQASYYLGASTLRAAWSEPILVLQLSDLDAAVAVACTWARRLLLALLPLLVLGAMLDLGSLVASVSVASVVMGQRESLRAWCVRSHRQRWLAVFEASSLIGVALAMGLCVTFDVESAWGLFGAFSAGLVGPVAVGSARFTSEVTPPSNFVRTGKAFAVEAATTRVSVVLALVVLQHRLGDTGLAELEVARIGMSPVNFVLVGAPLLFLRRRHQTTPKQDIVRALTVTGSVSFAIGAWFVIGQTVEWPIDVLLADRAELFRGAGLLPVLLFLAYAAQLGPRTVVKGRGANLYAATFAAGFVTVAVSLTLSSLWTSLGTFVAAQAGVAIVWTTVLLKRGRSNREFEL